MLALFVDRPVTTWSAALAELLRAFAASVPSDALRWIRMGHHTRVAEAMSAASAEWIERCERRLASDDDLVYFEVFGPEPEAPSFRVECVAPKHAVPGEPCRVEFRFPPQFAPSTTQLAQLTGEAPYASGYCGLALCASPAYATTGSELGRFVAQRLAKAPGLALAEHPLLLADQIACAQWITLLGPTHIAALGGVARLQKALPKTIQSIAMGHGIALIAGDAPSSATSPFAPVAKLLEKRTSFATDHLTPQFFRTAKAAETWLRRAL